MSINIVSVCSHWHTDLKLKADVVDGDGVLASEILRHTSEERLSEIKRRYPEHRRRAFINPVLKHTQKDDFFLVHIAKLS